MDKQQWLSELRGELAREKLPPDYVERLTSELSDHFTDFVEDCMSTDAPQLSRVTNTLGRPREIAHSAGSEYRQVHFCGRHPLIAFVVLPIVALPLMWVASVVCVVVTGKMLGLGNGTPPQWVMSSAPFILLAILAAPIALCAAFFCRLAARSAVSWKWTVAACCLLALLGSMAVSEIGVPTTGPARGQHGSLMFGFGVTRHPKPAQVFQFALPLAIGGWVVWRQSAQRRQTFAT